MAVIKTALISVSDKSGLVEFARGLAGFGADAHFTVATRTLDAAPLDQPLVWSGWE